MGRGGERNTVGIDDDAPAPKAESGPTVGGAKNVLGRQLSCAHLLIAPEHVALGMAAFGQQPVGQGNRLNRLAVINRLHANAGLFLEVRKIGSA